MYKKGEYVIYGNNGICRIENIGIPKGTPMAASGKEYYTLSPVLVPGIFMLLGYEGVHASDPDKSAGGRTD